MKISRGLLFCFAWAITASVTWADSRILIPVKINGQPMRFAFDTGADSIYLFHQAAQKLGVKLVPLPAEAVKLHELQASMTAPVNVEVLGREVHSPAHAPRGEEGQGADKGLVALAVINDPPQGNDIDGVIGWPVLRTFRMVFHGAVLGFDILAELPADTKGWTKLKERTDWNVLALELPEIVAGQPAYLGIDSGDSDGVYLAPEAWTAWRAAHARKPATLMGYYSPGAGMVAAEVVWADEIDLQGVKLRGVPVSRMDGSAVKAYPPHTLAVIGLTALSRLDMMFDGAGAIYLRAVQTPPPVYPHNQLGAIFMPSAPDNDALVAYVIPGSPAAEAGVRDGDILLKIDALDVTPWRTQPGILPMGHFWEQVPGTKLHLTLERGGKTLGVDVVLRHILGPIPK